DPRARCAVERVPGSTFYACTFEDLTDPGPYDAIVMSHVLEHALDPAAWLGRARALLAPGGVLAIALPNFGGVYRLLGSRDPFIIPPVHLNYFTARSLGLALRAAGLEPTWTGSCSTVNTGDPTRLLRRVRRLG